MTGFTQSSEETTVSHDNQHLKWRALDPLEFFLMVASGLLLATFTVSVFLDVLTRTLGNPLTFLPELSLGSFIWGVFIGGAVAVRRNQHFYLSAVTKSMSGKARTVAETATQLIMLVVTVTIAYFGYINFLQGFGSSLSMSGAPLSAVTAAIPVFGALTTLFTVEGLVNGLRNGFEGLAQGTSEQVPEREDGGPMS